MLNFARSEPQASPAGAGDSPLNSLLAKITGKKPTKAKVSVSVKKRSHQQVAQPVGQKAAGAVQKKQRAKAEQPAAAGAAAPSAEKAANAADASDEQQAGNNNKKKWQRPVMPKVKSSRCSLPGCVHLSYHRCVLCDRARGAAASVKRGSNVVGGAAGSGGLCAR